MGLRARLGECERLASGDLGRIHSPEVHVDVGEADQQRRPRLVRKAVARKKCPEPLVPSATAPRALQKKWSM